MPPIVCPLFLPKASPPISSHCVSFPSSFISLRPSRSLLTTNPAPLMGAISSLNTCRCLQRFGKGWKESEREREMETKGETKSERTAAGVVRSLSDVTYRQIPCATFELLMSPEADESSSGSKDQEERLSQCSSSNGDLAFPPSRPL
ncbi:hypothetical protein EYF80_064920 [Liparis tanakae]|uniref:Uncharacterized protein n=1 Tax=Liparis tanakae TaxID=230148 RepID=A0A4Z2E8F4_9TELE|nr:hypothetical protein EYF80_064920 [Liparis tanakae]